MRTIDAVLTVIFAIALFLFILGRRGEAAGQSLDFKGSDSGTSVTVPFDFDADSCTTTGGMTICRDSSSLFTGAGKQSGGIEAGEWTGQALNEFVPVQGTGCLIAPTAIKS